MIKEKDFLGISYPARSDQGDLQIIIDLGKSRDYSLAVRTAMRAFGDNPKADQIGILMDPDEVRAIKRSALYQFAAASSKGVGNSIGAFLPGPPIFDVTTFICKEAGCSAELYRIGHQPDDPVPICKVHKVPMVEKK